ncbi:S-adenosyl-L-methionine-dependent methyltransferase [Annulohypoxylon truncatum]|uniref:S-adenosyl-L-methionine-dependent methyltransferase n=1 Tax=Annulohypoxylon truncatum TaxID=327061 RepID=UPI0020072F77|nr:S-adenosyl-L-methionine-dependent methyltransferase [Annulohypoxylon truncatum]KAI1213676.1 S-adenosyl-L-methionine-dependent methyltransferase [Annulohypoxylon truncatum]
MSSAPRRAERRPPPSESDDSDSRDGEDWSDAEDEEETQEVISLLDDRVFPDVMSMLAHCKDKHGFDFLGVRQRLQLDFYGCIKLVNFIRQRVHEGLPVTEDITWSAIDQEQYLKPVLDDDAVILALDELPELTPAGAGTTTAQGGGDNAVLVDDLLKRNSDLQEELERVKAQFDSYRVAVQQTLDERWGDVDQAEAESAAAAAKAGKGKGVEKKVDESQYYWDSYAGVEIHETMLKDAVRTDAYRDFIYNNKHLFAGKIVLDIGCGTGILSMFCAKAGAAKVIAVDASAIITKAQENIFHNGLSSVITCVHGKMEEVSLPVDEVDVIVSEWMGYCLLFEAMLPSVLYARDRYLKPGGLLVPSHANLWVAPVSDPQYVADTVDFWRDIYGFDMRAMQAGIYDEARVLSWPLSLPPSSTTTTTTATPTTNNNTTTPLTLFSTPENKTTIPGAPHAFKLLDLYRVQTADLSFTHPYTLTLARDVDVLDGFLIWFDIFFSPTPPSTTTTTTAVATSASAAEWASLDPQNRVAFTTGPHGPDTHWKQGLLLCKPSKSTTAAAVSAEENGMEAKEGGTAATATALKKGSEITGDISFSIPEDHARGLAIKVTWNGNKGQTWALR